VPNSVDASRISGHVAQRPLRLPHDFT
jgi:hypothetical protein